MMHLTATLMAWLATAASSSSTASLSTPYDSCSGYTVSHVVEDGAKITADLDPIGDGCAVHGPDLSHLKLLVEYQGGELPFLWMHISSN